MKNLRFMDLTKEELVVPESLLPVLDVKRSGWKTILGTTSSTGSVWSVLLQYRGLNEYTLSVCIWSPPNAQFMLGHRGMDYGYYDSVEEAIAEMHNLFPEVEAEANWNDIARFHGFMDLWGIGRKTVSKLASVFSLEALCNASPSDIERTPRIGKGTALRIYHHFSREENEK